MTMTTTTPPQPLSTEALLRYRVVSEVKVEQLRGSTRASAVAAVSKREHTMLDGEARTVSRSTLYRWLARYEAHGVAGLEPHARSTVAMSAVLDERLMEFLIAEKKLDLRASVPELIERAREHGVLAPSHKVDRVTVWRAFERMGLTTRMRVTKHEGDMRRFAFLHRMQMVLCDGKKFRAGVARLRRVALFYLDDSSRYGLQVVVGTEETSALFLRGLYELVSRHGLMDIMYLDGGSGFIADDTATVFTQLPAALIHGKARYPEGHGKIERFHQTAIRRVLRSFDGAVDLDPALAALELRLSHYLARYNDLPHESLGQQTPRTRFEADSRALRFPDNETLLRSKFIVTERRRVSNDHVIQYEGRLYEAPRGLAREHVLVRRQVLDGELSILHGSRVVKLHEVDLALNARDTRGRSPELLPEVAPVKTAATLAFDRDYGPIVGPDGGFSSPNDE
jgi:transposase InsO family protein